MTGKSSPCDIQRSSVRHFDLRPCVYLELRTLAGFYDTSVSLGPPFVSESRLHKTVISLVFQLQTDALTNSSKGAYLIIVCALSVASRAVELFYYLKGGTVDYGVRASQNGHSRFGRTYAQGMYKARTSSLLNVLTVLNFS